MSNADQASPQMRLTVLLVVVACLFAALFARLWFLQVINAPTAQAVAADNGVRSIYTTAPRGRVLDRNGVVLVDTVNEPVIEVDRQIAAKDPLMVARLAALLGMPLAKLQKAVANARYSPYTPVPVERNATPQQILYVQENQSLFPGVQATSVPERHYTQMGLTAANVLGYVGQISSTQLAKVKAQGYQAGDEIGLAGVEETYESYLRGTPGIRKVQVDSQGHVLATLSYTPPVPGLDIRLAIDSKVQAAAVMSIRQGLDAAHHIFDKVTNGNFRAPAGCAVVEDPSNGEVIALGTDPSYNPALFVGGISEADYQALLGDPSRPLLDRCLQGQYAPGSTFKLVTATAGLRYGLITPFTIFNDTGYIQVGNFQAHNDNGEAYGPIDLARAITVSSDNFFNRIGLQLWYGRGQFGDDALQVVARELGFGSRTGIGLPNEAAGKVPTPASYIQDHQANPTAFPESQWYPGNSDQLAIGQDELLVTPLQLANAYAAFANGGTLYTPQLVLDARSAAGKVVKAFAAKAIRTVDLPPAGRAAMMQGFQGAVSASDGTAAGDFVGTPLAAMGIAGKTGTAQVNPPRQDTSVFTSFAPVANPRYVVDSFMEESGYGASVAAPVVREIYESIFNLPLQPVTYSATGAGGQN